jgi:putative endonuclease
MPPFESESRLTRHCAIIYLMETSDVSSVSRYYVYILYSLKDRGLYIGFTTNLKNRLIDHASNRVTATHLRTPVRLIHYEYFINKADAKAREGFLKSGYGRDQIKSFLKRTLYEPS